VSSCPGALQVICNYDSPLITDASMAVNYTQPVMTQCLTNSSYMAPSGVDCGAVNANCWIIPQATSAILFRCVPVYNVTNGASAHCVYPKGVTDADGACLWLLRRGIAAPCCASLGRLATKVARAAARPIRPTPL
jgi:hypothetical protein